MFKSIKNFIGILLVASIGGVAGVTFYKNATQEKSYNSIQQRQSVKAINMTVPPGAATIDFTGAAEKTIPAVVHVKTFYGTQSAGGGVPQERPRAAPGILRFPR